ncbi:MAG: hypothetical protein ACKVJG_05370 [Candidatus Latescibacterota bacterium]
MKSVAGFVGDVYSAIHSGIDRRSLHRLLLKHEIDASEVGRKAKETAVVE